MVGTYTEDVGLDYRQDIEYRLVQQQFSFLSLSQRGS